MALLPPLLPKLKPPPLIGPDTLARYIGFGRPGAESADADHRASLGRGPDADRSEADDADADSDWAGWSLANAGAPGDDAKRLARTRFVPLPPISAAPLIDADAASEARR